MISIQQRRWSHFLVVFGTVAISLFLTPKFSSEPVDLPKLFMLVVIAGPLAGVILTRVNFLGLRQNRIFLGILGAIFLQLTLVLLFSGAPFNQQFFGAFGRNTGFLAYFSLGIFMISSLLAASEKFLRDISVWLLVTGSASAFYGLLQITKHDPISWNNPYNPIIAFLGNPDFASAFLGISSATGISLIFAPKIKIVNRVGLVLLEIFCLFIALKSRAQQGVLVFGISGALVIYIFLRKRNSINRAWSRVFAFGTIVIGALVVLGIFRVGPLAQTLYKVSVRQRGFYWHAALEMAKKHPFFGIGLDSFGDNYLAYRSKNAAFYSMQTQSNAAHNVFLDFLSNGGFLLFFLYVALMIYVAVCGIKVIQKMGEFNPYFIAVFVAWVGYQIQSIVSINQLGLAIWGWVLSGVIIGYHLLFTKSLSATPSIARKLKSKTDFSLPAIGFAVGLGLVVPPFMTDHNYWLVATSGSANQVMATAKVYPEDLNRTLGIAQALLNAKFVPQALELARHVVSISPKNYNGWVIISKATPIGSGEHKNAIEKMQSQNPYDPTIK